MVKQTVSEFLAAEKISEGIETSIVCFDAEDGSLLDDRFDAKTLPSGTRIFTAAFLNVKYQEFNMTVEPENQSIVFDKDHLHIVISFSDGEIVGLSGEGGPASCPGRQSPRSPGVLSLPQKTFPRFHGVGSRRQKRTNLGGATSALVCETFHDSSRANCIPVYKMYWPPLQRNVAVKQVTAAVSVFEQELKALTVCPESDHLVWVQLD